MAELADFLLSDPWGGRSLSTDSEAHCDHALREFAQSIRAVPVQDLDAGLLALLNPTQNTISYLFVLLAQQRSSTQSQKVTDECLVAISEFLTSFDPIQVRYVGQEWRQLILWLDQIIATTRNYQLIILLRAAILGMDPNSSTFTTNHLLVLELCLEANSPRQALPILDKDLFSLPTDPTSNIDEQPLCSEHDLSCAYITKASGISGQVQAHHVQEYYLLGAHVYIGLRNYERARLFLEYVLATPTTNNGCDPYMVEAYKRLILLGLLAQGSAYSSSNLDQHTLRTIQSLSRAYDGLADAFKNRDVQKFHAEVDVAAATWAEDGNVRLVNAAASALRRYCVIDLQRTYAALPISAVASHLSTSVPATESLLAAMIRDGHLDATISTHPSSTNGVSLPSVTSLGSNPASASASASVLRFHTHAHAQNSASSADATLDHALRTQTARIESLALHVREADRKLALSRPCVDRTLAARKAVLAGGGQKGSMLGAAGEDVIEEMDWDVPRQG